MSESSRNVFKTLVPREILWTFLAQIKSPADADAQCTNKNNCTTTPCTTTHCTTTPCTTTPCTTTPCTTTYCINKILYKQAEFRGQVAPFLQLLQPYYYDGKRHFVEKTGYKAFLTILRQLCNAQGATYEVRLIYDKSSYEIEYIIKRV